MKKITQWSPIVNSRFSHKGNTYIFAKIYS